MEPTRQDDLAAIAGASYLAYAAKDRVAIEALIADDFHFTSPLDNRLDRETYFARCWPDSGLIGDIRFIHLATEGDRVFVIYEGRSACGKVFRNCEVLAIRDGKIHDAEVYFGWTVPHEAPEGGFVRQAPAPEALALYAAKVNCVPV